MRGDATCPELIKVRIDYGKDRLWSGVRLARMVGKIRCANA